MDICATDTLTYQVRQQPRIRLLLFNGLIIESLKKYIQNEDVLSAEEMSSVIRGENPQDPWGSSNTIFPQTDGETEAQASETTGPKLELVSGTAGT